MRRKSKPYKLKSKEFGRGPASVYRFATLAEAAKAVKEQWQGADYIDGTSTFHTDFSTWECVGFALADIGTYRWDTEFECREFDFHEHLLGDHDG